MDLAERLRPYVEQHRVLSEPLVDADPIRMFLFRWMIETGDPIEIMAVGFAVDPQLLADIYTRRVRWLSRRQAAALAADLGLPSMP